MAVAADNGREGAHVSTEDSASLTRQERTQALLEAAAAADSPAEREALAQQVVEINMPLAAQIAVRYRSRGVDLEDLEQVAYLALVQAVNRYEYAPDRSFISFAVPTIRGEVRHYFRDLAWSIRPTRRIQEAQTRISRAEGDLAQRLGRSPKPSELAEHLDLDLDLVVEALGANGLFTPTSLEADLINDMTWADFVGDTDEGYQRVDTRLVLGDLLQELTDRERLVLELRFFHQHTQTEIGQRLGITQMQVSRLLSGLMERLRSQLSPRERPAGAATGHPAA